MFKKRVANLTPVQYKVLLTTVSLLVIAVSFCIFVLRYTPSISQPNFYAEDGNVYLNKLLTENPISAALSGFNGYLVVGQYALLYLAMLVHTLVGSGFGSLAAITAIISCLFLAVTVSLPFILFRRELGILVSLAVVLMSAFVPLFDWDYAIIGTIGNLKFAFLYIAFLIVIYRNLHYKSRVKTIFSDIILLFCVVTNVSAAFILPFTLWPYRDNIIKIIRTKKLNLKRSLTLISAITLLIISFAYIALAYLKGIPKIAGYLDTPFRPDSIIILLDRISLYAVFHPITENFTKLTTVLLLGLILFLGLRNRSTRFVTIFSFWSLNVGAWLFVYNRPGITDYYLNYNHHGGPDQFFYASNLIFIFLLGWLISAQFKRINNSGKLLAVIAFAGYMSVAIPVSGSWGRLPVGYDRIGTSYQNVARVCSENNKTVELTLYPAPNWTWKLDRSIVCKRY